MLGGEQQPRQFYQPLSPSKETVAAHTKDRKDGLDIRINWLQELVNLYKLYNSLHFINAENLSGEPDQIPSIAPSQTMLFIKFSRSFRTAYSPDTLLHTFEHLLHVLISKAQIHSGFKHWQETNKNPIQQKFFYFRSKISILIFFYSSPIRQVHLHTTINKTALMIRFQTSE